MVKPAAHASTSGLLGKAPKPLHLLVRGGPADGEVVTISARKFLIGADPHCDLCLGGDRPWRLWLLRGARHTVVRSLLGKNRLNGKSLTDAQLRKGDCINLQGCALQVVDAREAAQSRERRARSAVPTAAARLNLRPVLKALARLQASFDQRADDTAANWQKLEAKFAEGQQALLDSVRDLIAAQSTAAAETTQELQNLVPKLCAAQERLEQMRGALGEDLQSLATLRQQWQSCDADRERLAERLAEVGAVLAQAQALAQAIETDRAQLDDQREAFERRRADLAGASDPLPGELIQPRVAGADFDKLQESLASCQSLREGLQEERLAWQRDRQQLETEFRQQREELARLEEHMSRQLDQLDEARKTLDSERGRLDALRTSLERESAELEQRRAELDARPLDDAQASDIDPLADQQPSRLEMRTVDLESRARELDQFQRELEARLGAAEQEIRQEREELARLRDEVAAERAEFERRSGQREGELDRRASELEQARQTLEAEAARLESLRAALDEQQRQRSIDAEATTRAPGGPWEAQREYDAATEEPSTSGDVIRRLQAAGIWKGSEPAATPAEEAFGEDSAARRAAQATSKPTARHEDEAKEESIDQYMARLLERARQNAGEAAQGRPSLASTILRNLDSFSPRDAEPAGEELAEKEEEKTRPPAEPPRRPKTPPPELSHDLTAMRELANLSARAAIDRYARRQQRYMVGSKAIIFVVSLVTGIFGFALGLPRGSIYWYAALAAFCIAGLWGIQISIMLAKMGRNWRRARRRAAEAIIAPADDSDP